jgi:hypothetical protein
MSIKGNIFGKTASSYQHLNKLSFKGLLDGHLAESAKRGQAHHFDGQLGSHSGKFMADTQEAAAGFGWISNNLQALKAEIEEVMYLNYRLADLVPIDNSIPEGAQSYAYRIKNSYGKAGFIDSRGTNRATASTSYDLVSTAILQGGMDAEWGLQDIRSAMFAGVPLQSDTLEDATVACLNHIEEVGLLGDSSKGFTGLVNNADVPVVTAASTLEASADAADQINGYLNTLLEQTQTIFAQRMTSGLTIYLPLAQFNFLSTKKYNVDASKTIMDYLETANSWTKNTGMPVVFKTVLELKAAGSPFADRMLIAFNNKKVMDMANPIQPRVIRIYDTPRAFLAPLEYSISQLNFKQPLGCLYVDGV